MTATNGEKQNAESSAFYANNDASSYNTRYLKSIRNKERFQELHFYEAPDELIEELFPKKPSKGTLDPPKSYCASAVTLSEWRDMEELEQLKIIEREKQKVSEEKKRNEEVNATNVNLKRSLGGEEEQQFDPAPPATKLVKVEEKEKDFTDQWYPAAKDINIDFRKERVCRGITLNFLKKTFPNDSEKVNGFANLVGKAMEYKAKVYSNDLNWPFALDPRIVGAIVDETSSEVNLRWICVQLVETANGDPITNDTKFDGIHFHHPSCDRSSSNLLCGNCKAQVNALVELCGFASIRN